MTYRRVIAGRRGGPEVLEMAEATLPEPGPGQVRVRIQAAGVSFADILMREGVHPETPAGSFTPGWDLAGVVDALGPGVAGWQLGQPVAAMPVTGGYAEYLCLPAAELVPVPAGLDPAEVACVVFNYVTAYQMLHRSVRLQSGQRILVHAAAGGIGTALLQLGRLAGGHRNRLRGLILPTLGMALSRLLPDGKAMTLYSVQTLRRRKPELYRQDVAILLDLLAQGQIKPLVAARLPLSQARQAHELLGSGAVAGKLVLICDLEA